MAASETVGALAGALAKAQGEMRGASRDSKNPHLNNRYADLASVVDASRAPLAKNGLCVSQCFETREGAFGVATYLMHESGEWRDSFFPLPATEQKGINPLQAMGSAATYGRRYSWAAIVGIAPDDDDDGHAAGAPAGNGRPPQAARPAAAPAPEAPAAATESEAPASPGDTPSCSRCGAVVSPGRTAYCVNKNEPVTCAPPGCRK